MSVALFLHEWGPLLGGVLVGAPPWVKVWSDARARQSKDHTDLVRIAQSAASAVIQDLRDEGDRLQSRVDLLEEELRTLRKDHAQTLAGKDAKITLLEAQLRQARAALDAYDRLLTAHGIPHERPKDGFFEISGGEVQPA